MDMEAEFVYADILRTLQSSILNSNSITPSWEDDTDEFLKSMLTGSDIDTDSGLPGECNTIYNTTSTGTGSDTSSDSGCLDDIQVRTCMVSPGLDDTPRYSPASCLDYSLPQSPTHSNGDSDSGEAVSPLDIVSDPNTTATTTTIILPMGGHVTPHTITMTPLHLAPRDHGPAPAKRRRLSNSDSDSGMEDNLMRTQMVVQHQDNKYPALELNEEEQKMAVKEGMKFPSHYPLTREEERNLKKIRRKIRNKLSAQDSRKRRKEYMDNMEDRVKVCSDENQKLKDKINVLETQNKTLAAQLRRLHQIVVNGGVRQGGQTSTALMVLLLSTALFLIPGLKPDQSQEGKSEIDIQSAVKMPPMPGQSRSLLQFDQTNNDIADLTDFSTEEMDTPMETPEMGSRTSEPPHSDHDYTGYTYKYVDSVKMESGSAWIEEDAPPMGYGPQVVKLEDEDRHMNVNVSSSGQGTKTVILQIPKDIK